MEAKDQFAGEDHAKIYHQYRRDAPQVLAENIFSHLKEKYDGPLNYAVDVGCGTGQGTLMLAPFFNHVLGIDVSEAQIQQAKETRSKPNVTYVASPAEKIPLEDESVQLLNCGSSLHWLQLDTFFKEARRVLCNNGILAVHCFYSVKPLLEDKSLAAEVDALYETHYKLTRKYHAPQALIAMDRYKDVHFPFEEVLRLPDVRDIYEGGIEDVTGYIQTFSGFQNFRKANREEAEKHVANMETKLKAILTASGKPLDKPMLLYRDYLLIICRKVAEKSSN